ncbi:aminoglycoside phosphotransferase family protein [Streptomyces sp. JH002]|uniref:phosphotransferase family protein n=1 Tax=Streptomyces sp. JH002 TaxID=2763259 RepID=UPI003D8046EF
MTRPTMPLLGGHHRVWHVLSPQGQLAGLGRLKAGRPRPGVAHFDPRCFTAEEDVLIELSLLGMEHIPPVHHVGEDGLRVHGYIEGETLSRPHPPGTPLPEPYLAQLMDQFGRLAAIPPSALELVHRCPPGRRPRTSRDFLRRLISFTRTRVYAVHRPELHRLFAALRIDGDAVLGPYGVLAREADQLTQRPFSLLHGDLHRDNLIIAESDGALWTIDWELALLGDPVYDLATHLHLMGYPAGWQRGLTHRWSAAVSAALPGAAAGVSKDLPRYLAYKRVQSVFTDVVRQAQIVRHTSAADLPEQLERTAGTVNTVLRRAAKPLGLGRVPSPSAVEAAYAGYAALVRSSGPPAAAAGASPAPPSAAGVPAGPAATTLGGPSTA